MTHPSCGSDVVRIGDGLSGGPAPPVGCDGVAIASHGDRVRSACTSTVLPITTGSTE